MKQIKLTIALCFLLLNGAFAQPIFSPASNLDVNWYGGAELFNTAMIAYGPTSSDVLFASAFNGGAIVLTDAGPGWGSTTLLPNGMYLPDVAFANMAAGSPDFILAVAHPGPMSVVIERYKVTTGPITITAMTPISITAGVPNRVHIEVIAQTGVPSASGYPDCNKFVVTWDDGGQVFAAYGDLNGAWASPSVVLGVGTEPDVAAIQRAPVGPVGDYGLITWVDAGGNALMYTEIDCSGATPGTAPTVLGGFPITLDLGPIFAHPRIDAIDDYTLNASPTVSQYKVVAEVNVAGSYEVRTYDNLLVPHPFTYWTSSSVVAPGGLPSISNNHYVPVVAYAGARQNRNYVVAHLSEFITGQAAVFMEPIDPQFPSVLSNNPNPNTYYGVNLSWASNLLTWDLLHTVAGPLSVAAPVNICPAMMDAPTLYAWSENAGWWQTNAKLIDGSYAFKQGSAPAISLNKEGVTIYPNPASSTLTVSAPEGTVTDYSIIDVAGRVVAQGKMLQKSQNIDVSKFTAGTYIIKMFKNGASTSSLRFAKE